MQVIEDLVAEELKTSHMVKDVQSTCYSIKEDLVAEDKTVIASHMVKIVQSTYVTLKQDLVAEDKTLKLCQGVKDIQLKYCSSEVSRYEKVKEVQGNSRLAVEDLVAEEITFSLGSSVSKGDILDSHNKRKIQSECRSPKEDLIAEEKTSLL